MGWEVLNMTPNDSDMGANANANASSGDAYLVAPKVTERFSTARFPDWGKRLTLFLQASMQEASTLRLDWDIWTCTSWIGRAIEAQTGENPYLPWRGTHRTPIEAARRIKESGFDTLDQLIGSLFYETPTVYAQRGDIGLTPAEEDTSETVRLVMPSSLVLVDTHCFWMVGTQGLCRGPLEAITHTYKIG